MVFNRDRRAVLLLVFICALLFAVGCSKPKPFAPTQSFAQRHGCPLKEVETKKEGSDRARVTGCGESELYVWECGNPSTAAPEPEERRQRPVTEGEAKFGGDRPTSPIGGTGCAWTRKQEGTAPLVGPRAE